MGKRHARRRHRQHAARPTTPGSSPGQVTADPEALASRMTILAYGPDELVEAELQRADQLRDYVGRYPVLWLNVDGLKNVQAIEQIGEFFSLHRLALEDVVHTHQRAKTDDYGKVIFVVLRMADLNLGATTEQLSMFLGHNFIITFQEEAGDCWEPIRSRLRLGSGQIRTAGPDYLAYALLDAVVDGYFPVLERYGELLEEVEDRLIAQPDRAVLDMLHSVKSGLVLLRRVVWPMREAIASLTRDGTSLIRPQTQIYLRDCHDHVIQVMDLLDIYRELSADLRDLYMSSVSNRINEIMRVLTIISTVFIPMTFIASIYGMNFAHMPELEWKWGYPLALGAMLATAGVLVATFLRRGWFIPADVTPSNSNPAGVPERDR